MCLNPRKIFRFDAFGRPHDVIVNCGRCAECRKRMQMDYAILAIREAEFRGSMHHLTLSYSPERVPMYSVLREYDSQTGELLSVSQPQRISRSVQLYGTPGESAILKRGLDVMFRHSPRAGRKLRKQVASEFLHPQQIADYTSRLRSCHQLHEDLIRAEYVRRFGRRCCRKNLELNSWNDGDINYYWDAFPSISRRDVSLWLKRCRVYYEREFGKKLPEFGWLSCGEFGPKNGRPHHHIVVCGLSDSQVDWMAKQWSDIYGNVKAKHVVRYDNSSPNHDGYVAAAKYLGKYLSKCNENEEPNVLDGVVERPRKTCSAHFGLGDRNQLDQLRSYYLCWDLFGKYDPCDSRTISSDKREALVSFVLARMHYDIQGLHYGLPSKLKSYFYHDFKTYGKFVEKKSAAVVDKSTGEIVSPLVWKNVEHSSFLSRLVSARVQEDSLQNYIREFERSSGLSFKTASYRHLRKFDDIQEIRSRNRLRNIIANEFDSFRSSVFDY